MGNPQAPLGLGKELGLGVSGEGESKVQVDYVPPLLVGHPSGDGHSGGASSGDPSTSLG